MKYQCGCVSTSLKTIIPRVHTTHLTSNKYYNEVSVWLCINFPENDNS